MSTLLEMSQSPIFLKCTTFSPSPSFLSRKKKVESSVLPSKNGIWPTITSNYVQVASGKKHIDMSQHCARD